MTLIFLWINSVLYFGLGIWCTLMPDKTSASIGFSFTKPAARSEYVTVYGGLEVAMGIFFLIAALSPAFRDAGILFGLVTYGCLAVFRVGTLIVMKDVGSFPLIMLGIELPMALWAAYLFFRG